MPITRIVADHRETTYHYFLRSLQPPIDTVVKEASGLICIFHMIVNLQCLVLSRVLVLSDTFLKDTAQPGTKEDESGVYASVAMYYYALHRMPDKEQVALFYKRIANSSSKGEERRSSKEGQVESSCRIDIGLVQQKSAAIIEKLERRILGCVISASLKLDSSITKTIKKSDRIGSTFGLHDEATRILEEALQQFKESAWNACKYLQCMQVLGMRGC